MDIKTRIRRRRQSDEETQLFQKFEALSPVTHIADPSNRGSVIEQLLDHFDPLFENEVQPNVYVYGPPGSGKTAIVQALFSHCDQLIPGKQSFLHTSTRVQTQTSPEFVYIDVREVNSEFEFCYRLLDELVEESVPKRGVGLETLQTRLRDRVAEMAVPVAVAVDHLNEPNGMSVDEFGSRIDLLPDTVCWLAIGREAPERAGINDYAATHVRLDPYGRQALIDILVSRTSAGLASGLLDHRQAQRIADWANGNAHDALAVLFMAIDRAHEERRTHLIDEDVTAALNKMPAASIPLGRVLALSEKRQAVLYELVNLEQGKQTAVSKTADQIATRLSADISNGTIKRYLYEMAEDNVLARKDMEAVTKPGRNPSRVEAKFPETAFRRLYDLQQRPGGLKRV